jgi:hypothetical protein
VYIDQGTGRIEHKPYRKARNHLERIPWMSSHPKDVKKGTFIGEMSRLATLSSTHASYVEAIQDLSMIYIARGYPPELIKLWLKDNTAIRWQNRLGRAESRDSVFVLKSHFNPLWNMFDVHELGRVVVSRWLEFLERQDELNRIRQLPSSEPGNLGGPPLPDQDLVGTGEVGSIERPSAEYILVSKRIGWDGRHVELLHALDIRKLGYQHRSWIVSRKRNFNLFDLVSKLKQHVLYISTDPDVIMDGSVDTWD